MASVGGDGGGLMEHNDTTISAERLEQSGAWFAGRGVEAWNPELNSQRESFEALFARTQPKEAAQLTIPLTDWSLIPFPPLDNGNASEPEELGGELITNTNSTHLKPEPSVFLQKSRSKTVGIEFAENALRQLAVETGISGAMDLSSAFKKLSTETWLDILDVVRWSFLGTYLMVSNRRLMQHIQCVQVQSPRDILSLCISCTFFYLLCLPRLYRNIRVRAPFHPGDMRWRSNSAFDRGNIPINLLIHPRSSMLSSKFPQLWQLGHYVQRLQINDWDAPRTVPVTALPQIIGPNTTTYDIWKGHWNHGPAPQVIQLWLGNPSDLRPPVSVNTALANLLQYQMQNLRSFRCVHKADFVNHVRLCFNPAFKSDSRF
jgi:hypothetical protein